MTNSVGRTNRTQGLMAGMLLVAALAVPMRGQSSVKLGWDASTDSSVVGYRLYWGVASRTYTSVTNVGAATAISLSNLTPGTNCYFAVTSYTANGLESPFSTEISYTIPFPSTLKLAVNASKQALLAGTGPVGYSYDVLTSRNLTTWTTNGSVTIGAAGTFQFTDPRKATNAACFYRLRQR